MMMNSVLIFGLSLVALMVILVLLFDGRVMTMSALMPGLTVASPLLPAIVSNPPPPPKTNEEYTDDKKNCNGVKEIKDEDINGGAYDSNTVVGLTIGIVSIADHYASFEPET